MSLDPRLAQKEEAQMNVTPTRPDAPDASIPQLTQLQLRNLARARYWLRAYEQEIGAQMALGSSRDGALSWAVGGLWYQLGVALEVIDGLTGGDR